MTDSILLVVCWRNRTIIEQQQEETCDICGESTASPGAKTHLIKITHEEA